MKITKALSALVCAGVFAAIVGAGCGTNSPATTPVSNNQSNASYTMADVQSHNSGTSCWTAINGNVYDVTNWINQHPGGPEAILSLCGTDGTSAFTDQHGGQPRPASELSSFKIGSLKQ